jgi:hypothetical protein
MSEQTFPYLLDWARESHLSGNVNQDLVPVLRLKNSGNDHQAFV